MKKLRFLVSLLCIQGAFAYDKTTVIEGLTFGVDRYNQHWLEVDDAHVPEEAAFSKAVDFLKQTKGKAIFVKKKPSAFEESLKAAGFENFFSNNDGTEWILKNNSPIPPAFSSIHSAQGAVIYKGKILCVEDKNRLGRLQFPGGAGEKDEFSLDAAIREVKEEVGLDVESIQLIGLSNEKSANRQGMNDHEYFYLMRIKDGALHEVKTEELEIASFHWVPVKDILAKKLPMPLNINNQKIIEGAFGSGPHFHALKKINPLAGKENDDVITHVYVFPLSAEKRKELME